MGEMKPTKGPWVVEKRAGDEWWFGGKDGAEIVVRSAEDKHGAIAVMAASLSGERAVDSNFRLIAEAGTVFHNTGLSPVQLVEMVRELKVALQDAEEYISGHTPTNSWGLLDRREDADRCETLEKVRAALAKCEGVGNE